MRSLAPGAPPQGSAPKRGRGDPHSGLFIINECIAMHSIRDIDCFVMNKLYRKPLWLFLSKAPSSAATPTANPPTARPVPTAIAVLLFEPNPVALPNEGGLSYGGGSGEGPEGDLKSGGGPGGGLKSRGGPRGGLKPGGEPGGGWYDLPTNPF